MNTTPVQSDTVVVHNLDACTAESPFAAAAPPTAVRIMPVLPQDSLMPNFESPNGTRNARHDRM